MAQGSEDPMSFQPGPDFWSALYNAIKANKPSEEPTEQNPLENFDRFTSRRQRRKNRRERSANERRTQKSQNNQRSQNARLLDQPPREPYWEKEPIEWTEKDVSDWTEDLNLPKGAKDFARKAFQLHRISGDILVSLHEHHLHEMCFQVVGIRLTILNAIKDLRKESHDPDYVDWDEDYDIDEDDIDVDEELFED
ncbi:hypothetical protein BZG36_03412 [Bifiguratus adelaidae]|uniref:SAM domain-containing protein n=1 Tax=Bifiguratus adelaidae TaxID=1938954 RepID=A0A261XYT2_9FUNG|nr:hypothetical protein BZG36_03412 [Bifiguratus adelaidae]